MIKSELKDEACRLAGDLSFLERYGDFEVSEDNKYIELCAFKEHLTLSEVDADEEAQAFASFARQLAHWAAEKGFLIGGSLPELRSQVFYVDYANDLQRTNGFIPALTVFQRPNPEQVMIGLGQITWEKDGSTRIWHWLHSHCRAGLQRDQSIYDDFNAVLIREEEEYDVYAICCRRLPYPYGSGAVMASIVAQAQQYGWSVEIM